MLNFVSNETIRKADVYTIENSSIQSIDLMEQASKAFVNRFIRLVKVHEKITVFCGKGNNGGDGLAIARLLRMKGYQNISVYILNGFLNETNDFKINKERLIALKIPIVVINEANEIPNELNVVIDAVLGSGFQGVLKPFLVAIFNKINQNARYIVSVDAPSGLDIDEPNLAFYQGIKADFTISFQRPKLFFMFPESALFTKEFDFVEIGLDEVYLKSVPSSHFWIQEQDILSKLKSRMPFSHKGTYGHLLLITGSPNTMGAALLCAKSALFSGAGLITSCIDQNYFSVFNTFQPEIMTLEIGDLEKTESAKFTALAIGSGLGMDISSKNKLDWVLKSTIPTVFDADALNMISKENLQNKIPRNSILTPHIKEFDRLFGNNENWQLRLKTAQQKAQELDCVIVLKNQYTFICDVDGKIYVNSTGNPSMAQGGMGDVLTGCIAAFLAQGYNTLDAALIGCYVHGKAGDDLNLIYEITPASLVAEQISKSLKELYVLKER